MSNSALWHLRFSMPTDAEARSATRIKMRLASSPQSNYGFACQQMREDAIDYAVES